MSRRSRAKAQETHLLDTDGIDEESEITRCVCGHEELAQPISSGLAALLQSDYNIKVDVGLFIQCDKCSVWQHGYCVGLFVDADVPDKYLCEMCRPENHILVIDDPPRTLYKPVNEKRRSLVDWSLDRRRLKRLSDSKRKDRRHDDYDEQLKRAIRELAKESGLVLSDSNSGANVKSEDSDRRSKKSSPDANVNSSNSNANNSSNSNVNNTNSNSNSGNSTAASIHSNSNLDGAIHSNAASRNSSDDNGYDDASSKRRGSATDSSSESKRKRESRTPQPGSLLPKRLHSDRDERDVLLAPTLVGSANLSLNLAQKPKSKKGPASKNKGVSEPQISKEELTQQPLKPRYVNPKLLLYELRKRTGAILEWLGRSQLELEEEKAAKLLLFRYDDGDSAVVLKKHDVVGKYDQNLSLMARLTENILSWEEKYGKYAP